jgi:hypothetical protein
VILSYIEFAEISRKSQEKRNLNIFEKINVEIKLTSHKMGRREKRDGLKEINSWLKSITETTGLCGWSRFYF